MIIVESMIACAPPRLSLPLQLLLLNSQAWSFGLRRQRRMLFDVSHQRADVSGPGCICPESFIDTNMCGDRAIQRDPESRRPGPDHSQGSREPVDSVYLNDQGSASWRLRTLFLLNTTLGYSR